MTARGVLLAIFAVALVAGCADRPAPSPIVFRGPGAGPVTLPPPVVPATVAVKRGDTVYAIARRYGVSVRGVIDSNRLRPPYKLLAGQILYLPRDLIHEVRPGDTLYGISRRYRVDMSVIARANRLDDPYRLRVGRRLRVPGAVVEPPAAAKKVALTKPTPASPPRPAVAPPLPKLPPQSGRRFLWPVTGKLVSSYGSKDGGLHNDGINIAAPRGTAVRAAEDGVVAYAGNELRGYGNLLLVRHTGSWTTAYAHNEKLLVRRGDKVRRGQVIAQVGSSGSVTTPQSHFELRQGARAIDPVADLSRN
jgi:murein DD-endopeptidase MepM/ murein hydrolase activator NlpD